MPYLIAVLFVVAYTTIFVCKYFSQKKAWNNGICPSCQAKWRFKYFDSSSARTYGCDECGKTVTIDLVRVDGGNADKVCEIYAEECERSRKLGWFPPSL